MIVRHRWVAAGSALAVIGVLCAAFLGIKIGAADSSSLAHSGPAYDTLQVLKDGGVTTGSLTPIEVLTETDKADSVAQTLGGVDGVTAAVVPTGPGSSVDGQTVVVLIPDEETVNSTSVQVVRDVTALADKTDGVIGVTGLGNAQVDFLHAVYGNFPLMLADHLAPDLRPAGPRVPVAAAAAQGGDPQPGVADRRLRPDGAVLAAGLRLERGLRDRGDGRGHLLDPADGLRVPVRAVDGLRGVHPVPDPGGVRRGRVHRRRRRPRHRPDRPAGHQCGADPVPRLRRARLRARAPTSRCWPPGSGSASCSTPPSCARSWCRPWSPCSARGTGSSPTRVARILRVQPSHPHPEPEPEPVAVGD